MTSTNPIDIRAARIVDTMRSLLNDRALAAKIDLPVDQAVESFRFVWEPPFSPAGFNRVMGEFLAHVHSHLCRACDAVPVEWSADEAVAIIAQAYDGAHEPGYDGALLDIVSPADVSKEGIDTVLLGLAEIIKGIKRSRYVAWVYERLVDPFDHELLNAVARDLVSRNCAEDLLNCEAFELTGEIRHLIETMGAVRSVVDHLRSEGFG